MFEILWLLKGHPHLILHEERLFVSSSDASQYEIVMQGQQTFRV
jgi:hypothetical protein